MQMLTHSCAHTHLLSHTHSYTHTQLHTHSLFNSFPLAHNLSSDKTRKTSVEFAFEEKRVSAERLRDAERESWQTLLAFMRVSECKCVVVCMCVRVGVCARVHMCVERVL